MPNFTKEKFLPPIYSFLYGSNAKIGIAPRKDLWEDQNKNGSMPGPGNYTEKPSTFGTTKGAASMGSKYKPERNYNPGPGEYDNDASKLKPN